MLLLAAALLFSSGQMQKVLNRDRERLGLTRVDALDNAPPVLAFTTVALGGFRGLISNFLWIRANDLQQDDKFFEAAQLATWITDLEPHFTQVWLFQAWNMAYNISVKFKDFPDRWRWVEHGIELLRDDGLRYNPNNVLIHRELAWFFQHKMGQNLDDANVYYKQQWADEMAPFFGPHGTNFSDLINPQTAEARTNAQVLRDKYKIDPVFAQKVDAQYGPFDWRLPEAHAIYWGALGLDVAKKNPDKVKADDLITLRRIIYQSMLQAFHHGRIIEDPFNKTYALEPNLDLVGKVNDAYMQLYAEETQPNQKTGILKAHRNFLKDAVYFLYENNRMAEAAKWYKLLGDKYPDNTILDGDTNSFPKNLTLDEYAVARVQSEIGDTSQERTTSVVEGLIAQSYHALAIGQDDRAAGFQNLAKKVYQHYVSKTSGHGNEQRVALPPFDVLNRTVLNDLLNTQKPVLPYAARAVIRTQLGMGAETNAAPVAIVSTNALPGVVTNAVENIPTNSAVK
ncbi:MAG TPA: hypothetical protein VHY30_01950 [Verrucomicrobiae bacterium]|nr:hypothetical protein [Verrucomicrobiae bacterium]